jgi:hypothetical protein
MCATNAETNDRKVVFESVDSFLKITLCAKFKNMATYMKFRLQCFYLITMGV